MNNDWRTPAMRYLQRYAKRAKAEGRRFLTEEFVQAAREAGIPQPHDARNYGSLVMQAQSERIIRKAGYKRARTSHHTPKTLWEAA